MIIFPLIEFPRGTLVKDFSRGNFLAATLPDKIDNDLKSAMKAGDKLRLETLRMMKSAVKYRQIEKGAISDEDVIAILSTLSKQRRDSIEQFRNGGREELARKEEAELCY